MLVRDPLRKDAMVAAWRHDFAWVPVADGDLQNRFLPYSLVLTAVRRPRRLVAYGRH